MKWVEAGLSLRFSEHNLLERRIFYYKSHKVKNKLPNIVWLSMQIFALSFFSLFIKT